MKKNYYFYSINFTLNKYQANFYYKKIQPSLEKIRHACSVLPEIKVNIFIDVLMMVFLRSKYPEIYREIYDELLKLYNLGISMEFFLNLEWEFTQDIHALDKERILDIFAIAKYILSPFNTKNIKTNTDSVNAVRIMNNKLQPFSYLLEAYQFIGIKLDASIVPRLRTKYYDYSKILSSKPFRFTLDPNRNERFGNFLALPRSLYKKRLGLSFGAKSQLNMINKHNHELVESFLLEKKVEYDPELVFEQQNIYFLTPDLFIAKKLYELILSAKQGPNSIVCLESHFKNISQLTFQNLAYLVQEKEGQFMSIKEIISMFSTTNNKFFK